MVSMLRWIDRRIVLDRGSYPNVTEPLLGGELRVVLKGLACGTVAEVEDVLIDNVAVILVSEGAQGVLE
eukprot:8855410-Pyramimonas_sp.AAC.1